MNRIRSVAILALGCFWLAGPGRKTCSRQRPEPVWASAMATASRQADVEGYECLGEPPGTWAGVEERLGFLGGAASLAVSMLGTGIVASPYCFALCGCLGGPAALLVLGGLVQLSYASLIRCTSQLRVPSYGGLIERSEGAHAVPRAWSRYTNVALWLLLILATTACVLISAHIIRSVASQALHASSPGLLLSNRGLFATTGVADFDCYLPALFSNVSAWTLMDIHLLLRRDPRCGSPYHVGSVWHLQRLAVACI
ncbi:unnamed protein product [Prorocentrum cordatum]|uniref:Amino acid transporter transmembrane domain-containing protein n=1 Tax=Prorocentrum cordatum TaxID=2364126 RepID=A0ABN9PAD0_9DINO|nr:unnamed protein product [Polarella glacialis]